jgi:hypothetical protein
MSASRAMAGISRRNGLQGMNKKRNTSAREQFLEQVKRVYAQQGLEFLSRVRQAFPRLGRLARDAAAEIKPWEVSACEKQRRCG